MARFSRATRHAAHASSLPAQACSAPGSPQPPCRALRPRVRDGRPLPVDARAQARAGHRRSALSRSSCCPPVLAVDRARGQARQSRPRALLPVAGRPERAAVPDAQVPHDGRERRGDAAPARAVRRAPRAGVQAPRRSSRDTGRAGFSGDGASTSCRSLVNVLRGEMSLVGPRPEQVEVVERYSPEHACASPSSRASPDRCRCTVAVS